MMERFKQVKNSPLLQTFISHYQSAELDMSSIAVAYYLMVTLFPILILLGNLLPFLQINTGDVLRLLQEHLPADLYDMVSVPVVSILSKPTQGLVWLSVATALWTTSKGLFFLQKAINKAYGSAEARDVILGRLVGALSGLLLIGFLTLAVFLSTFGRSLLTLAHKQFGLPDEVFNLLSQTVQPLVSLVFVLALGCLYYLLPNVKIPRLRYILPGSLFTSLVLVSTTSLFGLYISRTLERLDNLRLLGSVTIFALMLWFILFAKVVILGAVLNATYQVVKEKTLSPRRGKLTDLMNKELRDEIG